LPHKGIKSSFYEIHGYDVVVLGCMHEARDPEEWQKRATPPLT
jgi:hypothetical protein